MLEAPVLRERGDRHREAVVAQHDGLEVEREVAQLTDRRPRARESLVEDLLGLRLLTARDEVRHRVEHQRDPGQRLNGPVVQEKCDAASLVLLRRERLLGQLATPGSVGRVGHAASR